MECLLHLNNIECLLICSYLYRTLLNKEGKSKLLLLPGFIDVLFSIEFQERRKEFIFAEGISKFSEHTVSEGHEMKQCS